MKHQNKFNEHLDEQYSPVKIYDRLYPFSEVLMIRRPDIYEQMYYKFVANLAQSSGDNTPINSPVIARPRGL